MFQAFMIIGWAVLLIVLLYIWADVRETGAIVKEMKREMLRKNIGGRASGNYPNLREEAAGKMPSPSEPDEDLEGVDRQKRTISLNESEEQILREVLTEFLG